VSVRSQIRVALTWAAFPTVFVTLTLTVTGVSPLTSFLLGLGVLWQSLGGFLIWRIIRPASSLLELLGMGIGIGTAVSALGGLITSTAGLGPWGSLLPTAAALTYALARRRSLLPQQHADRHEVGAFLAAMLVGLGIFAYAVRNYPLTWVGSWTGYHPDMPFFEALANSLARFGAFESPFMSGSTVHYHWLSYAWTGQLSVLTGAPPFVGVTRVLPIVALLGSAAIIVAWTRRLSAFSWTPYLAGMLLVLSGFVGAVFGGILTVDSPSQAMSVLWLVTLTIALSQELTKGGALGHLLLLGVLSVAVTLGKVSAAAPAAAAVLLTTAVLVARRSITVQRASVISLATALPIAVTFLLFLANSSGGGGLNLGSLIDRVSSQQGLNPLDGPRGVLLGTTILILAVTPRWAGVLSLIANQSWRWRPETWISIGFIGSSLGALVLFNSFNEIWFSTSVSGPLAATSAVGAGLALGSLQKDGRPTTTKLLAAVGAASLVLFVLIWWVWTTGASGGNLFVSTQRWLGPLIAWSGAALAGIALAFWGRRAITPSGVVAGAVLVLVFVALPGRLLGAGTAQIGVLDNGIRNEWFNVAREGRVTTIDQVEANDWTDIRMQAANYLRETAEPTDLVATNASRSPFVAGATHLPTFVTGMVYQYDYGPIETKQELVDRERMVWEFVNSPQATNARFLCDQGVDWLWIDKQRTEQRSWEPFAAVVFENDETIIARTEGNYCG